MRILICLATALCASVLSDAGAAPRTLVLDDRVVYQERIERVLWSHRIWPQENGGSKPRFEETMSREQIRSRIEDDLKKSDALARLWGRPLTSDDLAAELKRIAASTRDPQVLREMMAELDDDPFVIAEVLVRPLLADRRLRQWFASDERWIGETRTLAESGHKSLLMDSTDLPNDFTRSESTWARGAACTEPLKPSRDCLDDAEWTDQLERLAEAFEQPGEDLAGPLPLHQLSALKEDETAFYATIVLEKGPDRVRTSTFFWPKPSFDTWWALQARAMSSAIEPANGTYTLPAVSAAPCTPDTWRWTCCPTAPSRRSGHSAVWTGSEMIVWGSAIPPTGSRYSPATDSWRPTSTAGGCPSARSRHTAIWTGSRMIVWGGTLTGLMNTGGIYDPVTDTWTPTSTGANVPTARVEHQALWTGTRMIVWGGTASGGVVAPESGALYDPSTDSWTPISQTNAPNARWYFSAVWTGTSMIVWGGNNGSSSAHMNTGGRYDPVTDSWQATSTAADVPEARRGHTAVWTGTRMIVWGGQSIDARLRTGASYDPGTDNWTALTTDNAPTARSDHEAVWTGSQMVVWGGRSSPPLAPLNTGGKYDASSGLWSPVSLTNAPSPRHAFSLIWTGSELIVWGGIVAGNNSTNTGGRYNPTSDVWTPTTTSSGAPATQSEFTAVWTGSEMLIWGWENPTGSRYSPATDSWTPMMTWPWSIVPVRHTAVWTGSRMIIFGGDSQGQRAGGLYDPSLNRWSGMSAANAPSGREGHTAVWTGTRMIVWGGGYFGVENTGGVFDPTTNSWTPTGTAGSLPVGRMRHSAVWTGREMIVWGGDSSDGFGPLLDSGGRYDPAAGTWSATSMGPNLPSARYWHQAVWTGRRMIVPGGTGGGKSYDPVADAWSALSTSGAPSYTTPVVWTGSEMILWGGSFSSPGTGGRYDPQTDSWLPTSTAGPNPSGRQQHTAVWTGTEMIVWGGWGGEAGLEIVGGLYCAAGCSTPQTWYQDSDSDGYGISSVSVVSCTQPFGYAALTGDCNDTDPSRHLGAFESCNGIDDDCDVTVDEGAPPGTPALTVAKDDLAAHLSWTPACSTRWDVVKGSLHSLLSSAGDFTSSTTECLFDDSEDAFTGDSEVPSAESGVWYLVRGSNLAGIGSYDCGCPRQQGSRDTEIAASAAACP